MGNFKITCEEATTICTKSQYGEASLMEIIKLQFHLLTCKICRAFSKQNRKLSDICNLAKGHQELKEMSLSDAEKEKWKEQVKELENNK